MTMCCPMGIYMKIEVHFIPVNSHAREERSSRLQALLLQGARRLTGLPGSSSTSAADSSAPAFSPPPPSQETFHG